MRTICFFLTPIRDYSRILSRHRLPSCNPQRMQGLALLAFNSWMPRTMSHDSCARFPTLGMFILQALGLSRLPWLRHLNVRMSEWAHDSTRAVDQVIGAFFLIRRSLFDSLGGFDERYFVYLEDLDLSLRAHQAGWKSVYLANTQAFHPGGGTSRQVKARRLFYSLRSRLLYGFKHFKPWQAWILLSVTLLLEPVTRTVFCLSRGELSAVGQTWQAYKMLYAQIPNIRRLSFQKNN